MGAKLCVTFLYFNFERGYDVLKTKSPCIFLNKNINFNRNKTESKMENLAQFWRDAPCFSAHRRIANLKKKKKTVMSYSSRKKKKTFFLPFIFSEDSFFKICVLSQCIVYWINFQNIHTFTNQKILLHTLVLLVSKTGKSLQCILKSF